MAELDDEDKFEHLIVLLSGARSLASDLGLEFAHQEISALIEKLRSDTIN